MVVRAVSAQSVFAFVFAYAKNRFSHGAAYTILTICVT